MKTKEWYVYSLEFKDGSRYYGMSGTKIGQREREHKLKWEDKFIFKIHSSGYNKKSEALMMETFLISQHYILGDRSKLRNHIIGRFGF